MGQNAACAQQCRAKLQHYDIATCDAADCGGRGQALAVGDRVQAVSSISYGTHGTLKVPAGARGCIVALSPRTQVEWDGLPNLTDCPPTDEADLAKQLERIHPLLVACQRLEERLPQCELPGAALLADGQAAPDRRTSVGETVVDESGGSMGSGRSAQTQGEPGRVLDAELEKGSSELDQWLHSQMGRQQAASPGAGASPRRAGVDDDGDVPADKRQVFAKLSQALMEDGFLQSKYQEPGSDGETQRSPHLETLAESDSGTRAPRNSLLEAAARPSQLEEASIDDAVLNCPSLPRSPQHGDDAEMHLEEIMRASRRVRTGGALTLPALHEDDDEVMTEVVSDPETITDQHELHAERGASMRALTASLRAASAPPPTSTVSPPTSERSEQMSVVELTPEVINWLHPSMPRHASSRGPGTAKAEVEDASCKASSDAVSFSPELEESVMLPAPGGTAPRLDHLIPGLATPDPGPDARKQQLKEISSQRLRTPAGRGAPPRPPPTPPARGNSTPRRTGRKKPKANSALHGFFCAKCDERYDLPKGEDRCPVCDAPPARRPSATRPPDEALPAEIKRIQGRWRDEATGEAIGTIRGGTLHWAKRFSFAPSQLRRGGGPGGYVEMDLSGQAHRAEFVEGPPSRLRWSDGEVWVATA